MASVDALKASALLSDSVGFLADRTPQENIEQIFARKYISRLNEILSVEGNISDDVSERLRAARNRAIVARKISIVKPESISIFSYFWRKIFDFPDVEIGKRFHAAFCVAPFAVLFVGLFVVADITQEATIAEKAVVDIQIMVDILPPQAYLDRGFLQFLKQVENFKYKADEAVAMKKLAGP